MKDERKDRFGIYVTAKKPNFPERFRADNGKNRNIPERNLSKQTIKWVNQFVDKTHEDKKKKKKKKKMKEKKTIFNG